jgi:hypothetical protein
MVALGVSVAVMIAAAVALTHSRASGPPADGKNQANSLEP